MSATASRRGEAAPREPFDRLDSLSSQELRRWWRRRIRRVLDVAWDELPFYRRRFEAARFHPRDFRRLEDHAAIPRLEKAELVAEQRRRSSCEIGIERGAEAAGTVLSATSGTEGTMFYTLPPRWRRQQGRSSLRAHWWAGLRPGAPFLLSAPAWHGYAVVQTWWNGHLPLQSVITAGTYLPRFAPRIVDAMITFRPAFATLFLPMVFSLLAEARRRGLAPQEPFASIQTLIVAGLPITPGMRAELERETGIPRIVEIAGASENLLAVECDERRGLHLVPDTCYAEVIDPTSGESAAPGERGRVVHTALIPWGSLFVAYDSGDLGTLDPAPCPCGLPSPRIKLHGRADDAFALGDRTLLPFDVQLAVESRVPELAGARFAIMREALEAGRLELVMVDGEGSRALEEELERQLRECYQTPVRVRSSGRLPLQFKGVPPLLRERETG